MVKKKNITTMDDLYLALHQSALTAEGGISGIAHRKGWRVQTAINKVNPHDLNAEPKVGEFISIMMDSGDTTPLDVLCAMFDGQFTTRTSEVMPTLVEAVLHAYNEHADIGRAIENARSNDGVIDTKERTEILREIAEARKALVVAENTLNATEAVS